MDDAPHEPTEAPAPVPARRPWGATLALTEVALALLAAFLLTGLLTVPLLISREATLELAPVTDRPLPDAELVRQFEDAGLARRVEIDLEKGQRRLILTGFPSTKRLEEALATRLMEAGFQTTPPRTGFTLDPNKLFEVPSIVQGAMTLQALVFVVVGGFLVFFRQGSRGAQVRSNSWLTVIGWGLVGGIGAFGASVAVGLVLRLVGVPVEEQEVLQRLLSDPANVLRLSPWIVLLVPLSEEVFFRFYAFRFLGARVGWGWALVASSVLFAISHGNLTAFPVYVAIGAVLAGVYRRSASLVAPIVGHAIHNAIVLLAALLLPMPAP